MSSFHYRLRDLRDILNRKRGHLPISQRFTNKCQWLLIDNVVSDVTDPRNCHKLILNIITNWKRDDLTIIILICLIISISAKGGQKSEKGKNCHKNSCEFKLLFQAKLYMTRQIPNLEFSWSKFLTVLTRNKLLSELLFEFVMIIRACLYRFWQTIFRFYVISEIVQNPTFKPPYKFFRYKSLFFGIWVRFLYSFTW